MSNRLTYFAAYPAPGTPVDPKSKLDRLALAAGMSPFPDSSDPVTYGPATAWDPTRDDYAVNDIVYGPEGGYFRCTTDNPPAGTPLSHGTYWATCTPDWVTYMNTVRATVETALWTSAGWAPFGFGTPHNLAAGMARVESAVVSGPWEISLDWFTAGGLQLTESRPCMDSTGHVAYPCAYGFQMLELLSQESTARLDLKGSLAPGLFIGTTAAGDPPVDTSVVRYRCRWAPNGYVTATIAVNVTGSETPTYDTADGHITWDPDLRLLTWQWTGELLGKIEVIADSADGDFSLVTFNGFVYWPGPAATLASNVVSSVDVYRAGAATLPRVVGTAFAVAASGALLDPDYADSAHASTVIALPGYLDGLGQWQPLEGSQWRLRAKTFPASDVRYANNRVSTYDPFWQRQWYACQRAGDTRVITPTTAQQAIREIDTVWGKRAGAVVDQVRPVVDRAQTETARTVQTATVGYQRVGDSAFTRVFSAAALSVSAYQMEHCNYLGRSNALIIWDNEELAPLPLRWDGAGLWVAATGPIAVYVPNPAHGWSWTGGGAVTPTALGYLFDAATHYDDLLAVLEASFPVAIGGLPTDQIPAVDQAGTMD